MPGASASGRRATIQVFCGGGVTPDATWTSRALAGARSSNCSVNDFWRVARITMTSTGSCLIVPIDTRKVDFARTHWPFLRDRRVESYGDLTRRYID